MNNGQEQQQEGAPADEEVTCIHYFNKSHPK